jgi:hypothetical protein
MALTALVIDFYGRDYHVHYGDVGGWLGGVGSISAAVAAVGIAIHGNRRQNRKEDEARAESRARALRRARNIRFVNNRYHTTSVEMRILESVSKPSIYAIQLENNGYAPIYEVQIGSPLVAYIPSDGSAWRIRWAQSATVSAGQGQPVGVLDADPFVLGPGESAVVKIEVQNMREPTGHSRPAMPFTTFHRASYVDEEGYLVGWTYGRTDKDVPIVSEGSVRGRWAFVTDGYPGDANDALRELVEQVQPGDNPLSGTL